MPAGGDKILIADYNGVAGASLVKPVVRLVQTVAQSIPHNVAAGTALTFAAALIDTDGYFNAGTSTTRVTPSKAGYFRVTGAVFMAAFNSYGAVSCWIRKSGSTAFAPAGRLGGGALVKAPGTTAEIAGVACDGLVDMNGTTDYVELMVQHNATTGTAAQLTNVSSQFTSAMTLIYERGL